MLRCEKCRAELKGDEVFCPKCGKRLSKETKPASKADQVKLVAIQEKIREYRNEARSLEITGIILAILVFLGMAVGPIKAGQPVPDSAFVVVILVCLPFVMAAGYLAYLKARLIKKLEKGELD